MNSKLRIPLCWKEILDYGSMAGMKFSARSAQRTREAEDALLRMCNG